MKFGKRVSKKIRLSTFGSETENEFRMFVLRNVANTNTQHTHLIDIVHYRRILDAIKGLKYIKDPRHGSREIRINQFNHNIRFFRRDDENARRFLVEKPNIADTDGPSRKRSREEEKEETGPQPSSVKSRAQQYERMLSEKLFLKLREENEKNKRELQAAQLALREAAHDRTELHRQLVELETLLEAERAKEESSQTNEADFVEAEINNVADAPQVEPAPEEAEIDEIADAPQDGPAPHAQAPQQVQQAAQVQPPAPFVDPLVPRPQVAGPIRHFKNKKRPSSPLTLDEEDLNIINAIISDLNTLWNEVTRNQAAPEIPVALFRRVVGQFLGEKNYPDFLIQRGLDIFDWPELDNHNFELMKTIFAHARRLAAFERRKTVMDKDIKFMVQLLIN
ncbi:hypothetical protein HNY73_014227 [Argiope bruennichi]|uniref:SPK domain-containing protein n=1 Tax=Argiope bruennichi TaxID=94029 RepID=A0A8T0EPF8_ARGBR|nr:hypothetical protein HNY73_014227 [Argiope bruennichi]